LHGMAFVAGFSLIFIGLGLAASAIGSLLYGMRVWMARLGGILISIFGLHMTGLIHISWLDYDLRPENSVEENRSYFSSLLMGILFSAGWSPCVGPVLSAILTLAVNEGSLQEGLKLLTAYSVGFAIPFLITALGIGWISSRLYLIGKFTRAVEIAMGIILVMVGILLFLGLYEQIAQFSPVINTGL
jgi:cytochrome c-type biogenesis protein